MADPNAREVFQVEIRIRDLRKAVAFYGAVFDWRIYPSAPDYALVDSGAMPVIGLMQTRDPNFPLGICNNVLVEDCQQAGERAVSLGGRICVRKWVVPGSGAYVGTLDPWGSEMFFWEPFTSSRPNLKGSGENPVVLVDYATTDLPAAIEYYSKLVGWSFSGVVFDDQYAFAEGCGLRRGVGLIGSKADGRAAASTDYVAVADLAAAAARITEGGGRVVVEPAELPGEGRFLIFEDPEGNRLGALQRAS